MITTAGPHDRIFRSAMHAGGLGVCIDNVAVFETVCEQVEAVARDVLGNELSFVALRGW